MGQDLPPEDPTVDSLRLLTAAQQGDAAAMGELIERHLPVLIGAEAAFAVAELHLQAAATGPRIGRAGGGSECLLPLRRGSMDLEQDVGVLGGEVVELAELPEQAQHAALNVPDGTRDLVVGQFGSCVEVRG